MSAINAVLPRKWNLVIAQAAVIPKVVLSGTDIAATSRVSLIDVRASAWFTASHHAFQPWRSASNNTAPNGSRSRLRCRRLRP